jgi:23S rRNA (cytosine1962-C5)-methyltransferase
LKKGCPEQWQVQYKKEGLQLVFRLGLTSFKHVGLFPEQAAHWQFLYEHGQRSLPKGARLLNLFAYTGAASLAARAAGLAVTHLDSVRQVISWSRENMELSGLQDIRWVVEDALKFVQREVRRGNTYEAIVLDPPAYGRGPEGEKWILEDHLPEMMQLCGQLLQGDRTLFLMNLYSLGLSGLVIENLIKQHFEGIASPEIGELFVEDDAGRKLPLGTFGRFVKSP